MTRSVGMQGFARRLQRALLRAARRLRSALALFAPVLPRSQVDALNQELRWVARELSDARDLDVFYGLLRTNGRKRWCFFNRFDRQRFRLVMDNGPNLVMLNRLFEKCLLGVLEPFAKKCFSFLRSTETTNDAFPTLEVLGLRRPNNVQEIIGG